MKQIRWRSLASHWSNLYAGWLGKRWPVSERPPLKRENAKRRLSQLRLPSVNAGSQPWLVDYLDVNAELGYATVVERLEEFHYEKEFSARV
jgi:hypothetical protein